MSHPEAWSGDIELASPGGGIVRYTTDANGKVVGMMGPDGSKHAIGGNSCFGGLAGIGDSITANGVSGLHSLANGVIGSIGARNWQMWASILSGGRIIYAGVVATGGYTTQQIIDNHLQTVVDAVLDGRVSTVTVLAGTNDIGSSISLSTIKSNLQTIYNALTTAGAKVIACTLTPRESAPGVADSAALRTALQRLNAWILLAPTRNKNVFALDLHAATATVGSIWKSGFNGDNVHPNSTGAKAMGTALRDLLLATSPLLQSPVLANTNSDTGSTGYSQVGNPLFTDTNADGTPDGVSSSGSPTLSTNTTGSGILGNYLKAVVTQTASSSVINIGNSVAAVNGDLMLVSARIKTSVESVSANAELRLVSNPSEAVAVAELLAFDKDIPDGSVITFLSRVPSLAAETSVKVHAKIRAGIGASIELGQLLAFNLTTAGLD